MQQWTAVTTLPASLNEGVGACIVAYAALETAINGMIYMLLDLSDDEGRIAFKDFPLPERWRIIKDLMDLNSITTKIDFNGMDNKLDKVKKARDALAHGVWVESGSDFAIRKMKPGARKKKPVVIIQTDTSLNKIHMNILSVYADTLAAWRMIEAAPGPSRYKYISPLR